MLAEYKRTLLMEVGAGLDGLPDEVVSASRDVITPFLDVYWEMHNQHGQVWPGLQYLYVKRTCLDLLMGQNRDKINVSVGGTSVPQSTIVDHLETLRKNVLDELVRLEGRAQASRAPAMATMASSTHADQQGRLYDPLAPAVPFNRRVGI